MELAGSPGRFIIGDLDGDANHSLQCMGAKYVLPNLDSSRRPQCQ